MKGMHEVLEKIIKLQSKEYVHEITKELSLMGNDYGKMGFRCAGSTGEWHTAYRIAEEMKAIGLKDVAIEKFPVSAWEPLSAKLTIDEETIEACPYAGTSGTPNGGVTAEIVDVGRGAIEDYRGKCVEDKIVFFSFDMLEDYWVNIPAYQAMKMGAKAVICSYEGEAYSLRDDSIGCFDGQMLPGFPVVNISRKAGSNLRERLVLGKVIGCLDVEVNENHAGESSNVIGYIHGKDPSKMIVLAGHMDGFFNTYQDDVLAIGINLDIAKSILLSGYEPEHTIAVVAHGSEEYGVSGSHYDWCTGSWNNVNVIHPEWFGKVVAFLNIDAVRPDTDSYNIACTPEWKSFFTELMCEEGPPPKNIWPNGSKVVGPKGPWADGYNYSNFGVPEMICGGGPSQWSALNYHTQFDNYSIYESEKELIDYVTKSYTKTLLKLDKMMLPPLDFSHTHENLIDSLKTTVEDVSKEAEYIVQSAADIKDAAADLYEKISSVNGADYSLDKANAAELRCQILECYKLIHKDIMKLAVDDSVVFPHEPLNDNIRSIDAALSALDDNDMTNVIDKLRNFDLFWISYSFDEETYRYTMYQQDHQRDDLYWGTGKIHKLANTSELVSAIKERDFDRTKRELLRLRVEEIELLQEALKDEVELLNEVSRRIGLIRTMI